MGGSLHIAAIKYLPFQEDSQNFLKLMASSLCLDSTTVSNHLLNCLLSYFTIVSDILNCQPFSFFLPFFSLPFNREIEWDCSLSALTSW